MYPDPEPDEDDAAALTYNGPIHGFQKIGYLTAALNATICLLYFSVAVTAFVQGADYGSHAKFMAAAALLAIFPNIIFAVGLREIRPILITVYLCEKVIECIICMVVLVFQSVTVGCITSRDCRDESGYGFNFVRNWAEMAFEQEHLNGAAVSIGNTVTRSTIVARSTVRFVAGNSGSRLNPNSFSGDNLIDPVQDQKRQLLSKDILLAELLLALWVLLILSDFVVLAIAYKCRKYCKQIRSELKQEQIDRQKQAYKCVGAGAKAKPNRKALAKENDL